MSDTHSVASERFRDILDAFARYDSFWISSHIHPDPDAIGSQLALARFLEQRGKTVEIVNESPPPRITHWLPGVRRMRQEPTLDTADALIVLDVSDRARLGKTLEHRLSPKHAIINIDHHATGKPFADIACVVQQACATCEILFDLFEASGDEIDRDIAECLYAGIIGDTGNFRFSNTTPHAHEVATALIRLGVEPAVAYERIYGAQPERRLRLLGMVLATLRQSADGAIATMRVTQEMFRATGTDLEDVDGFSDYARSVDGVVAAAFFGELPSGKIKVSFRARGAVRVNGVAASLGGGGHEYAAGCTLDPPMDEAERRAIAALATEIERANG